VSTCSFHATKIFHTGEGGALFTKDPHLFHKCFYSHNFGHNGPLEFHGLGINAKISELHAAMGLSVLPYMDFIIAERNKIVNYYCTNLNFLKFRSFAIVDDTNWNFSYYPVVFESEEILIKIQQIFNCSNIFPRRYFYPSLNKIEYTGGESMPVSESISERILCLPLYVGLDQEDINKIVELINSNI
jgi:dTDP-4-amino-4,6-dideoxygalactose transaminase